MEAVEITVADAACADVVAVLERHLGYARAHTAPEAVFALDGPGLLQAGVTVFCGRQDGRVVAIGALRELDPTHGELKSMHTVAEARGQGVGRAMVDHIVGVAQARGYARVSLETGAGEAFAPARALYRRAGFARSGPFGDYADAATSVFMTRELPAP